MQIKNPTHKNELSHQQKQYIKAQLGKAQNTFEPLILWGQMP